jgi:CheY-like chemotaxis protein
MIGVEKRILIVDDDSDFLESLSCFLEANHFLVLKAHDGAQALKLAKIEHPDLILMDVMMGERTEGLFTVQEIRRDPELQDIPIFVLSALYSQVPEFEVSPDRGWLAHDEFLSKPVDMSLLLAKIHQRIGVAR